MWSRAMNIFTNRAQTPYTSSRKPLFLLSSSLDKINLPCNFTLVKLKTIKFEPVHEISNNVVCVTSNASDQPAHMRGLIRAIARCFEYSIIVKLLIEHHLQFQSLKVGCGGSSGSAVVKMSNCWKSHAAAQF